MQIFISPLTRRSFSPTSFKGDERKSLSLPGKVVESLSHSPDPKEVVLQLKETLHLDQTSLKHPEPETKQLIRCLAKRAKHSNRLDVVRHLREITPAGTTGELVICYLPPHVISVRSLCPWCWELVSKCMLGRGECVCYILSILWHERHCDISLH